MSIIAPFLAFLLVGALAAYHRLRLPYWAAITITALVLNHRSWMHDHHDERDACRHYIRRYEQLMSIVATHRESRAIYRALD